jgi:hypothetical protein
MKIFQNAKESTSEGTDEGTIEVTIESSIEVSMEYSTAHCSCITRKISCWNKLHADWKIRTKGL